jgi:hypothetical protein
MRGRTWLVAIGQAANGSALDEEGADETLSSEAQL